MMRKSLPPKGFGIEMALRNMSPQIIMTDELVNEDLFFIKQITDAGADIIATVHGSDALSAVKRIGFEKVIKSFGYIVTLCNTPPFTR